MEKTYKRVPFDIELAKKIQSKEVEGRIVTLLDNVEMEILTFNSFDKEYPIIARYKDIEEMGVKLFEYHIDGKTNPDGISFWFDLNIELPEETPEEQHPIEESELYQAGYKVGFEAGRCVAFDEKKGCAIKEEAPKQDSFNKKLHDTAEVLARPKHEFKPFDRVLVRDCSKGGWQISFFSHIQDDWFITNNGHMYKECIPFAGNEHLVGTTNKPKED